MNIIMQVKAILTYYRVSRCVVVWVELQVDKVKNCVKWFKHSQYDRAYYYDNVHNRYLEESSFGGEKAKDCCTCVS
jgi:hypothetical protein